MKFDIFDAKIRFAILSSPHQEIFGIFLSRIADFYNIELYPSRFGLVHDGLFSVTDGARDVVNRVLDVVLDAVYHFALNLSRLITFRDFV
jgi:hypothetical protein